MPENLSTVCYAARSTSTWMGTDAGVPGAPADIASAAKADADSTADQTHDRTVFMARSVLLR